MYLAGIYGPLEFFTMATFYLYIKGEGSNRPDPPRQMRLPCSLLLVGYLSLTPTSTLCPVRRNLVVSCPRLSHPVLSMLSSATSHSTSVYVNNNNEKALRETQTLHTGCSKAEPKIEIPRVIPQTPFPRGVGQPKFNQLEMVTTLTYKPSLMKIDSRNFELSW